MKVQMWGIGAEQTVVAKKHFNESGAKGSDSELYYSVLKISQPEMGGAHGQNKAVRNFKNSCMGSIQKSKSEQRSGRN